VLGSWLGLWSWSWLLGTWSWLLDRALLFVVVVTDTGSGLSLGLGLSTGVGSEDLKNRIASANVEVFGIVTLMIENGIVWTTFLSFL